MSMNKKKYGTFVYILKSLYSIVFFVGVILYFLVSLTSYSEEIPRIYGLYLTLFGICTFLYFFKKDNLFCFETIFFLIYFLGAFFPELVLQNITENVNAYYSYTMNQLSENKSLMLHTIGLYGYLWISAHVLIKSNYLKNDYKTHVFSDYNILKSSINYDMGVRIICFICSIFIIYLFLTGIIASWFHYSNSSAGYSNLSIVYLTIFFLLLTALEFTRLARDQINSFKQFLKKTHKIYLVLIISISILLIVSGNRNECLLILLPPVIAYSTFIHRINNNIFVIGTFIGVIFMIIVGTTRQTDITAGVTDSVGLFESTRDFGVVNLNTSYLIEYTDQHGPIYFQNGFMFLVSSIPLLGSLFELFGFSFATRTPELTTFGLQDAHNMDSGFGTALIGDIYYSGLGLGVLLYMVLFGYLMSSLYVRFNYTKKFNIWLLLTYLFMFANAVYCVRAEWTMPFRYLGFSFFLLLVVYSFIKLKK